MADPFAPGLLLRLPRPPRKVALLRASRIGDFLCATPAFRALRAALPEAEITLITLPMLRGLALRSPYFDRVVDFPGFPGVAEQLFDARRAIRFCAGMQAEHLDLAVQMQGSGVYSNPFALLMGARATAGFIRPEDGPGRLDAALPYPQEGHEVHRALALTTFLGAPAQGEHTEFPLWPEDHMAATALLADAEAPLIGLHAGARDATRRWPLERFAQAGAALRQRYGGTLVLLGDAGEQPPATALAGLLGAPLVNLAGHTSVETLGAVIARLTLLLTNDSGPAHIAYALRAPAVTVFGGADPAAYGPLGPGPFRVVAHAVPCRPRGGVTCPTCAFDHACLRGVSVEFVLAAAEQLLVGAPEAGGRPLASVWRVADVATL